MSTAAWLGRRRPRPESEPTECLGCGGELAMQNFAFCQAAVGDMTVTVYGLPFRACRSGCADRRFAISAFAAATSEALLGEGEVPVARLTGEQQLHCRRCMSRQIGAEQGFATVAGEVRLEGIPAFSVHVTGPAQACANCGLVQLVPTVEGMRNLGRALAEIYRAAGLRDRFR